MLLENAVEITPETKPPALAVRLLRMEIGAFQNLSQDSRETACSRLVKLGASFRSDALAFSEIVSLAAQLDGLGKQTFRSAVREELERQSLASAADQDETALTLFAATNVESPLFFDGRNYWRKDGGIYGQLCREDARLHLGIAGLRMSSSHGRPSPADRALQRIQIEARVNYAGPLCGRLPGLIKENGHRVLVTRGPAFIEPKRGECPTINTFIGHLVGHADGDPLAPTQAQILIGWIKLGRLAILNPHEHRPGQVLGLVGPPDCGKSLFQSLVLTPAYGGRVADPALWMTGASSFNSDLWGAEHLAMGDKGLGEDGRERARLRDELKRVVAAPEYPLHAKHRDALTMRHVWRVSLSINDDPESAASLPALDASFSDKIIYLKCYAPPKPFFDENEKGARMRFAKAIADELPAFLAEVDAMEIPAELRKERFGIREFHHPAVLDLLVSSSPLMPLSEVLQSWMETWDSNVPSMALPSVELYNKLDVHLNDRLRPISSSPRHLGHQLARLALIEGWQGRIVRSQRRLGGRVRNQQQTVWTIHRDPSV